MRHIAGIVSLIVLAGGPGAPAEAAPVLCQRKNGALVVREGSCRKKEAPVDLSRFGATGPKGDPGPPGPTLYTHTQNVESNFPIGDSPTVVAVAGAPEEATYSGSYSGPLVHPSGYAFMAVAVQAHVANVTGTGVVCGLERRANQGSWTRIAETPVSGSEAFLNASFPSFSEGTSWAFRIVCRTDSGSGTARGEIGAVGAVRSS